MFSRVYSAGILGIDAHIVCVEADVSGGLPQFSMVGLLSSEVREARERVTRALSNSGIELPPRKITVNLSPASMRKQGSGFDIPIAVSILAALGIIKGNAVKDRLFIGELSLDGHINKVKGILPIAMLAKKEGFKSLVIPEGNGFEGAAIDGIDIYEVSSLEDLVKCLNEGTLVRMDHIDLEEEICKAYYSDESDYSDIKGQEQAKRATQVAVAGFHNLLYIGPPGSGKSMLAKRIPSILSSLSCEESLEISKIYSAMGLLDNNSLILKRPFRSPHHTVSGAALVGGGSNPHPGEITLAHKGVLFLDEAAEFKKDVIEMLRQPIEDRQVIISRTSGSMIFPCDFMLVMAMNPCRCGYYPDRIHCRCTEKEVENYFGKIRGPVLDRIDICVSASKLEAKDFGSKEGTGSAEMKEAVIKAREIQKKRFGSSSFFNSQMSRTEIEKFCIINDSERRLLDKAYDRYNLSARGYYKILKVARTIADLDGCDSIGKDHLIEAISYRNQYSG